MIQKTVIPLNIFIPTIRDDHLGFCKLWSLLFKDKFENLSVRYSVRLDFSKCNYIGLNTSVVLGIFIKSNIAADHNVIIDSDSMNEQVFLKLKSMDFFAGILPQGFSPTYDSKYADKMHSNIPFKIFKSNELNLEDKVLVYLETSWLSKNRVNFSDDVKSSVLSSLWEIFANAFEHGASESGVFCSGTYDKSTRVLNLIVGDTGIGIVESVKNYNENIKTSKNAILWALKKGNSTYTINLKSVGKPQPRGLGFDILRQLVDVNGGLLEIYTDNVVYQRIKKQDIFHTHMSNIKGSWVKVSLNCKEDVIYRFQNEVPNYF